MKKASPNETAGLSKLSFLLVIFLVAAFVVRCSPAVPDFTDTSSSNNSDTVYSTADTSFTTHSDPTTQSDTTADSRTETTSVATLETNGTTYPSATLPSARPGATTRATTAPIEPAPSVSIGPSDITDAKMNELITRRYLTIHPDSRSGLKLTSVKSIVIHYVGNPGTTADQNWRNFENNKPNTSAHFIIGLDGEILQLMPLDEVAWAVGTEANYTSISIECCHPDESGRFTDATYESLLKLTSWLCNKFGLGRGDVERHYDHQRYNSSGIPWRKVCPKWFVDHPEEWERFKNQLILK